MQSARQRRRRSIRSRARIGLGLLLLIGIVCSSAYGQAGLPAEGTGEQAAQPEAPREVMSIGVREDLLTVDLLNADFGKVLKEIGSKKGFKVEINREVSQKKITTKFRDIDLERGILRLLTLMKEKNYTIHYDSAGAVSFVDVFGASAPAAPAKTQTPATRPQIQRAITSAPPPPAQPAVSAPPSLAPQTPRRPPVPVTTFRRPAAPAPLPQEQPQEPVESSFQESGPEEDVPEVPYIPSQSKPVYIPPRTR